MAVFHLLASTFKASGREATKLTCLPLLLSYMKSLMLLPVYFEKLTTIARRTRFNGGGFGMLTIGLGSGAGGGEGDSIDGI